jgi:beta-lactamase regulating signal transducer with metallopeptidase domain/Leucine-rich repeat (LRR) protein
MTTTLTSIFEALLKASWQGVVLIGLVLLAQWIFRRRLPARWRYCLWLLVLLRLLVPISPESAFSVYNLAPTEESNVYIGGRAVLERYFYPGEIVRAETELTETQAIAETSPVALEASSPKRIPVMILLMGIWLVGVVVLGLVFMVGIIRFSKRVRLHRIVDNPSVIAILNESRRAVGLNTPVVLVETPGISAPAMYGMLRPRLLLPQGFIDRFSQAHLRLVFLHELTHLKRRDHLVNWLILTATLFHWFNPIVWLAFIRMRADRELACDEQVLLISPDSHNKDYGRMLITLMEDLSQPARLPGLVGIVENKNDIERRIKMIARFTRRRRWYGLFVLPLAIFGLVTLTDAKTRKRSADKDLIATIKQYDGKIKYDESQAGRPIIGVSFADTAPWTPKEKKVTDTLLERLGDLKELEELELCAGIISDQGLAHLKDLSNLRKLNLKWTPISGAGLKHLKEARHLTELNIARTEIDDSGLACLQQFPNLEILHLGNGKKITDAGLVHLVGLRKLRELTFVGVKLTQAGSVHLAKLTNLEKLVGLGRYYFSEATFDNEALRRLKNLSKLKHLDLGYTKVNDEGMETLKNFPNLRFLSISRSQITGAGLSNLKHLTDLEELHLGGPQQYNDQAIENLKIFPKLKRVFLGAKNNPAFGSFPNGGRISDASVRTLANLGLEILQDEGYGAWPEPLRLCGEIIDDSSLTWLKKLAKLEGLHLGRDSKVTDAGLAHLRDIKGLKRLEIYGGQFTANALAQIGESSNLQELMLVDKSEMEVVHQKDALTNLKSQLTGLKDQAEVQFPSVRPPIRYMIELAALDEANRGLFRFQYPPNISDVGLAQIGKLENLTELTLNSSRITDAGLKVLKRLRKLEKLVIIRTQVTDAGVIHLSKLPKLRILYLDKTKVTDITLRHLKEFPELEAVSLRKTSVTSKGIEESKKEMPHLDISN